MKFILATCLAALMSVMPTTTAHAQQEDLLFENIGVVLYFMELNERIRRQCNRSMLSLHNILDIDQLIRTKAGVSYLEALDLVEAEGLDADFFDDEAFEIIDLLGCSNELNELWFELQDDSFEPALRAIAQHRN
ncbi:hypothetical protein FM042_10535 [Aliidiomarina halalkaliphila]|uniref:DUF3718 domain-containing protein n=1 Tax=Aliidiomarina halalkaliphila TaxID=2593535 RepID=A0A552WZH4_9GAMM|nr:hypothetical protein [Aliidiomarina halalkaliphila]TRW48086.1 hypothetical protein FM042_10535 [Aliidiomarina halalkaliphila]